MRRVKEYVDKLPIGVRAVVYVLLLIPLGYGVIQAIIAFLVALGALVIGTVVYLATLGLINLTRKKG